MQVHRGCACPGRRRTYPLLLHLLNLFLNRYISIQLDENAHDRPYKCLKNKETISFPPFVTICCVYAFCRSGGN